MPGFALQPIARSTPVRRQRTAPDERSDMREHANESRITDVSRLRSHRCTIIASTGSNEHRWARRVVLPGLDMGHKSEMRELSSRISLSLIRATASLWGGDSYRRHLTLTVILRRPRSGPRRM